MLAEQYSAIEFIRFSCFSVSEILRVPIKSSYLQTYYLEGMRCSGFKLSYWEHFNFFFFLYGFLWKYQILFNYLFSNITCFHLCFRQRVQHPSLFALYKSLEIISFFFSDNFFRNTKKGFLLFFQTETLPNTFMHELLFPAHIAFLTEGPHWVCLRHQAHNCTVLGFRHSAVDWSVVWGTTASCSQNSFLCHSVQGGSTDVLWPLKCLFSGVPVCWAPCEASLCGSGAHKGPPLAIQRSRASEISNLFLCQVASG